VGDWFLHGHSHLQPERTNPRACHEGRPDHVTADASTWSRPSTNWMLADNFSLKAGNGEIIATSQMYDTKAGDLNGIESVKKNASGAPVDDQSDKPAE
jgi:uncharacterized protein